MYFCNCCNYGSSFFFFLVFCFFLPRLHVCVYRLCHVNHKCRAMRRKENWILFILVPRFSQKAGQIPASLQNIYSNRGIQFSSVQVLSARRWVSNRLMVNTINDQKIAVYKSLKRYSSTANITDAHYKIWNSWDLVWFYLSICYTVWQCAVSAKISLVVHKTFRCASRLMTRRVVVTAVLWGEPPICIQNVARCRWQAECDGGHRRGRLLLHSCRTHDTPPPPRPGRDSEV